MSNYNLFSLGAKIRDKPTKQQRCRYRPSELSDKESGNVHRANTGKRIRQRSGNGDGRIGERRGRREPIRGSTLSTLKSLEFLMNAPD
jgi:hypothetical protein